MLRRILGTVFLLVTFLLSPTSATAQRYDSVVIMGDSSADDGYQSDHLKAGRLEYYGIPVSPEQGVNGRFSNGLSIPEQLYHELGFSFLETENYAVGAAQTGWGFSPDSFWFPVY